MKATFRVAGLQERQRTMVTIRLDLDEELIKSTGYIGHSIDDAVRELVVVELYRRGTVSSGKAAELLGMDRYAFIRYASGLGIPFIDMTDEEWQVERRLLDSLPDR
jgi:predicted HTH domain antitoxin